MVFPQPDSKKFAVFIVNTWQLANALNDVLHMYIVASNWGVHHDNMHLLIDTKREDSRTKFIKQILFKTDNIYYTDTNFLNEYTKVLKKVQAHSNGVSSSLYIQISGHGSQVKDVSGDGKDEAIYPNGRRIVDDDLLNKLVSEIGSNFYVLTASDTCHSGTMFDFPYSGESLVSKKVVNIPFVGISLSGSSDTQVNYEVPVSNKKRTLDYISTLPFPEIAKSTYRSLVSSNRVVGSLSAALVEFCFNGINDDNLKQVSQRLGSYNQTVEIHSTIPASLIPNRLYKMFFKNITNNAVAPASSNEGNRQTVNDDNNTTSSLTSNSSENNTTTNNSNAWVWILVVFLVLVILIAILYVFAMRKSFTTIV